MQILIKHNIILLAFFIIFASKSHAAERILPIPKPEVDQEIKIKTEIKKYIYPEKKPISEKEKIDTTKSDELTEITDEAKEDIFIYP